MSNPAELGISVSTAFLESRKPTLPSLALQVTTLVDSYMLWVGVCDGSAESKERAIIQGNLCKDWAVAMSPRMVRAGSQNRHLADI
jgi:proteasome assembly chaperone 4